MLKFLYKRITDSDEVDAVIETASIADTNPDLKIRDLLDDPGLRRAMQLDVEPVQILPVRPLDRRRLLEQAAA